MKCSIEDCENESEFIFKHLMSSGMYCKKHFYEIYNDEKRRRGMNKEEQEISNNTRIMYGNGIDEMKRMNNIRTLFLMLALFFHTCIVIGIMYLMEEMVK